MNAEAAGLYRERLDIELNATLETAMHVGEGSARPVKLASEASDEERIYQVAEVLFTGPPELRVPFIPGSTIKGLLRSLLDPSDDADAAAIRLLFGWASPDDTATSQMGLLLVYAALPVDENAVSAAMAAARSRPERRTALDADTGAAAAHKLFAYDVVPAGTAFRMRLRLLLPSATRSSAEAALGSLLHRLTKEPIFIGRSTKAGHGRAVVSLADGAVIRCRSTCEPAPERNWLGTVAGGAIRGQATPMRRSFKLVCRGPYLSKDPFGPTEQNGPRNIIQARRDREGRPILLATSLLGALRKHAAWREILRSDRSDRPDVPLRQRYLAERVDGQELAAFIETNLTPVERLFGVNGLRGLLQVESLRCTGEPETISMPSVALDRFSMAPMHGALYTFEASLDPTFEVVLSIEKRTPSLPSTDDLAFLDELLGQFSGDDLLLGHGTSKGFGWFRIESVRHG